MARQVRPPDQEVWELEDSLPIGSESDSSDSYQEDQEPTPPGSPSGWMGYIETRIIEVREGRAPEGILLSACKEFTNHHSAAAADPRFRFGAE